MPPTESASRLTLVERRPDPLPDFSDRESQRVLAAAHAVARELGRQAAREYVAEAISKPKAS